MYVNKSFSDRNDQQTVFEEDPVSSFLSQDRFLIVGSQLLEASFICEISEHSFILFVFLFITFLNFDMFHF